MMSNDLISRSALIEAMNASKRQPTSDENIEGYCEGWNDLDDIINEQPTAYNVEKVVEELHEFSLNTMPYCNEMLREDLCDDSKDCDYCKLQHAIDIVRKGGVE